MTINELLEKELKRRLNVEKSDVYTNTKINPKKFIVEKYYDGFRAIVHKEGNELRIYSDSGKDVSKLFSKVNSGLLSLNDKDFIIDCEVLTENANPIFYVSDLIYLEKDLTGEPLNKRKQLMKKLVYSDNIKEVPMVVVDSTVDTEKALSLFKGLKDSKGVMVKDYNSKYALKDNNCDWVLFNG